MLIEKPLIPGLYLMIVNNYKIITIPSDSLNQVHLVVIVPAKFQPKDQMQVALPFRLTQICGPTYACLILSITRGTSKHTCLT